MPYHYWETLRINGQSQRANSVFKLVWFNNKNQGNHQDPPKRKSNIKAYQILILT